MISIVDVPFADYMKFTDSGGLLNDIEIKNLYICYCWMVNWFALFWQLVWLDIYIVFVYIASVLICDIILYMSNLGLHQLRRWLLFNPLVLAILCSMLLLFIQHLETLIKFVDNTNCVVKQILNLYVIYF